jgi:hypothetical protein
MWLPWRDTRQYVFLDECGVTTDLIRRYGRSPRGERLRDHPPCGPWETHTVIAGLRLEGLTAPAVFNGPIDQPSCLAYVEQVLAPSLRPGDAVQPGLQTDRTSVRQTESRFSARRGRVPTTTSTRWPLRALTLFTPDECANYLRNCRYRVATEL